MKNIYSCTKSFLEEYFLSIGEKKFKATQIFEWLYDKGVKSFDEMTNIKKDIIEKLKSEFTFDYIEITKKEHDNDTYKYLFI